METRIELLWSKYYSIVNNTPQAKEQELLNARFNNTYMQNTTEGIRDILDEMDLDIVFNLPLKKQMDSLDVTALVIAVEGHWMISITDEDQESIGTIEDLVKLIQAKLKELGVDSVKPTIDEQLKYMDVLLAVGHRPAMVKAIKENLIAVRLIGINLGDTQGRSFVGALPSIEVWKGGPTTTGWLRPLEEGDIVKLAEPLSETEKQYISGMDVEPPFQHPSGHSFTEGHEL